VADIRVLIADDDPMVRSALTTFVTMADGMVMVGEAADGIAALEVIAATRPDVVLMDVKMPNLDGVAATAIVRQRHPKVRVLALTTFSAHRALAPMVDAGAVGFLLKDAGLSSIADAIRSAAIGTFVLSASAARKVAAVAAAAAAPAEPLRPTETLTPRETDVIAGVAEGLTNAEIAAALGLSEPTVKGHIHNIMAKWQARDRVQLVLRAARTGLVTVDR
jgi:DNA-binding NarL/FixJ family response regulator